MRLLPIINRLKSNCPLLNGNVEFAASLLAPDDAEIASNLPMVWVYPEKEVGTKNNQLNSLSQMTYRRITLIIFADNSTDLAEPIADIREQIKSALGGFKVTADSGPLRFAEGDISGLSKRHIEWRDTYEIGQLLSKNP